jgi:hypothetical protein
LQESSHENGPSTTSGTEPSKVDVKALGDHTYWTLTPEQRGLQALHGPRATITLNPTPAPTPVASSSASKRRRKSSIARLTSARNSVWKFLKRARGAISKWSDRLQRGKAREARERHRAGKSSETSDQHPSLR